jgi:hypothetical protein
MRLSFPRPRLLFLLSWLALGNIYVTAQPNPNDPADPTSGVPRVPSAADSLPAFKTDSLRDEPFRQIEAGAPPAGQKVPQTQAARDSATSKLRGRGAAVSAYLGVSFLDLDAKQTFANALEARRAAGNLRILQNYEPVHLAFPLGLQAVFPIGNHFDFVAKTYSYWYTQSAILGDSLSRRQGDEDYSVQANLGGVGLRFYMPPDLLSVSGSIALYVQGVYYWQIAGAEIYTQHGSAPARFAPEGSAYEILLGFQQDVTKPWSLTGTVGFMQQNYSSDKPWSDLLPQGAPPGNVEWSAASLQAAFNLWYHFGVKPAAPVSVAAPASGAPGPAAAVPSPAVPAAPRDSAAPPPPASIPAAK